MVYRPKRGESVSGDRCGIWQEGGRTLASVIDGLGSGLAAVTASEQAMASVEANRDRPLADIFARCHETVSRTRGVVMGLARIEHDRARLTFCGVGNIGFSAASKQPMHAVSQNGLLGQRLPTLLEFKFTCSPGDRMVVYSDGISALFVQQGGLAALGRASAQELAQQIADRFGRQDDDLAVAVLTILADPGSRETGPGTWS